MTGWTSPIKALRETNGLSIETWLGLRECLQAASVVWKVA